jgi:hypothetical protein
MFGATYCFHIQGSGVVYCGKFLRWETGTNVWSHILLSYSGQRSGLLWQVSTLGDGYQCLEPHTALIFRAVEWYTVANFYVGRRVPMFGATYCFHIQGSRVVYCLTLKVQKASFCIKVHNTTFPHKYQTAQLKRDSSCSMEMHDELSRRFS